MPDNTVRLRYIVTDEGTISVLDRAGKELGQLERAAVDAGDKGSQSLDKLGASSDNLTRLAKGAAAAVAALGTGVAVALRSQLNTVDDITKQARSAGTAVEDLSRLRVAADLSGISIGELGLGLGILNRRLIEAAGGTGRAQNVLRALGVTFQTNEGLLRGNLEVLTDVAEAFSRLPDGPQKTAAAMELFGRSGAKFISLLNSGRQGIAELIAENDRLGLSFDSTFGARAELVNDNLARIRLAGEGLALTFLERVSPALAQASEDLLEFLGIAQSSKIDKELDALLDRKASIEAQIERNRQFGVGGQIVGAVFGGPSQLTETRDLLRQLEDVDKAIDAIDARREVADAVRSVNKRIGDDLVTQDEINGTLRELGQVAATSKPGTDALAGSVEKIAKATGAAKVETQALTDQYGRLVTRSRDVTGELRQVTVEIEDQADALTLSLGDAFRRLTTGGGDFALDDLLLNAAQDQIFTALDQYEINFTSLLTQDLPNIAQRGWEAITGIFSESTADLVSGAQQASGQLEQVFGRGFQSVAQDGQVLAQVLSGLGVPVVGGGSLPLNGGLGYLAGGRFGQTPDGRFAAIDAFGGRFTGSDPNALAQVASGLTGGGGGAAGGLSAAAANAYIALAIGSINGGIAGVRAFDRNRDDLRQTDKSIARLQNEAALGAFFDVFGLGDVGSALGGGLSEIGGSPETALLAGISGLPFLGEAFAAFGVRPDFGLFPKIQRSDQLQQALQEIVRSNPSFIEQANFKFYRSGIDADRIFRPTVARNEFFRNRLGIEFFGGNEGNKQFTIEDTFKELDYVNTGRDAAGDLIREFHPTQVALRDVLLADPNNLEEQLRLPAFGVGAVLRGGNLKDTADVANTLINNILLTGQEFSEEAQRQLRVVLDTVGVDLFTAVEELGKNFTLSQQVLADFEFGDRGFTPDLNRDQTLAAIEGIVTLFNEDLPAGVDVLATAAKNLGEQSFNTAVFFKDLERQIEIFGTLEQDVLGGLKRGILADLNEATGASVLGRGGTLQDAVRAVGRQGSAFTSVLVENIRDSVGVAITEGVFDAVEATPAWQALTDQIAAAVKDPKLFATLPSFIGGAIDSALPAINAAQTGAQAFFDAYAVTPVTLFNQSDAFRGRAEQLRFGRLTPEQQLASIDRQIDRLGSRVFSIYGDAIDDATQAGELADLFGRLGGLGEQRLGLADILFPGGGVANERRREAFAVESIGFVDSAAAGLGNLGRAQQDAITGNTAATENQTAATNSLVQSNNNLGDRIDTLGEIIQATALGNVPPSVIAQAVARMLLNDPVSRAELEHMAAGAR